MNAYASIASQLRRPMRAVIGGAFRPAFDSANFDTRNPFDGVLIAELPACKPADIVAAVAASGDSFVAGVWSGLHPAARKAVLARLADLLMENLAELAVMEALDAGKPIADADCLAIDIPCSANWIRWHGEAQDKLYDQRAQRARHRRHDPARADRRCASRSTPRTRAYRTGF
ncbi:MAG: aldehyde dehydrogenase family protein [Pseudomonadota bacterium]